MRTPRIMVHICISFKKLLQTSLEHIGLGGDTDSISYLKHLNIGYEFNIKR